MKNVAIIVVDPQNDFCPGGALAVEGGDEIMPGIEDLTFEARMEDIHIIVTQDWHPANHMSFAVNNDAEPFSIQSIDHGNGQQVMWPKHCVQGTKGAEFHDGVEATVMRAQAIIRKGYNSNIDSYSAFYENDGTTPTGLVNYLREKGITTCYFVGLAFDFCVGSSALDARRAGFEAAVIKPLTRSIGEQTALDMTARLQDAGAMVMNEIPTELKDLRRTFA